MVNINMKSFQLVIGFPCSYNSILYQNNFLTFQSNLPAKK
jgi:hypothetical protein